MEIVVEKYLKFPPGFPLEEPDKPLASKVDVEEWIPRMVPGVERVHVMDSPERHPGQAWCAVYGPTIRASTLESVKLVLDHYGVTGIVWEVERGVMSEGPFR